MNLNDKAIAFTDEKNKTLRFRGSEAENQANVTAMYGEFSPRTIFQCNQHRNVQAAVEAVDRGEQVVVQRNDGESVFLSPHYISYLNDVIVEVTKSG